MSKIIPQISTALGLSYHLHASWGPQSSAKAKRLIIVLRKCWPTFARRPQKHVLSLLPIVLLGMRMACKVALKLSLFETLYGRLFLLSDILFDSENHVQIKYIINLGLVQKVQLQGITIWVHLSRAENVYLLL